MVKPLEIVCTFTIDIYSEDLLHFFSEEKINIGIHFGYGYFHFLNVSTLAYPPYKCKLSFSSIFSSKLFFSIAMMAATFHLIFLISRQNFANFVIPSTSPSLTSLSLYLSSSWFCSLISCCCIISLSSSNRVSV